MILGEKLRRIRRVQNMTMQEVADASGLSVGFVSQVERNLTVPSLTSLQKLARAVHQPMDTFLDKVGESSEITRASERPSFSLAADHVSFERLSHDFEGSQLTSLLLHEPPGHRSEPVSHKGEELIFVLKGEVTLEIEGLQAVLSAGDSYHFASSRSHSIWNHTRNLATVLWCGTLDVFGSKPAFTSFQDGASQSYSAGLAAGLGHG